MGLGGGGGGGGAFMTSLWQLKRFEARISLFKSLDCPLALAAAGMNQRFTRYPPVINHNLGWCNCSNTMTPRERYGVSNQWLIKKKTPKLRTTGPRVLALVRERQITGRFLQQMVSYTGSVFMSCDPLNDHACDRVGWLQGGGGGGVQYKHVILPL